jgi:nucleoside-diphosphate-sugar epimerase
VAADLDPSTLGRVLGGQSFDLVFHLAAYGVRPTDRDAGEMFRTNVAGTAAVVEFARQAGARGLVAAGSCAEYAPAEPGSLIDEEAPLAQSGLYGASKAAAGLWALAAGEALRLPLMWMRLFGVYGPGEAPHRLLPAIAARLARDEPVALSPGGQIRDMMHVDDAVAGLIAAGAAVLEGARGAYNLCTGEPVSIRAVAELAADALGKPHALLDFGAIAYRPGETMWLAGSPRKFHGLTGFAPPRSLGEGVAETVRALAAAGPEGR